VKGVPGRIGPQGPQGPRGPPVPNAGRLTYLQDRLAFSNTVYKHMSRGQDFDTFVEARQ